MQGEGFLFQAAAAGVDPGWVSGVRDPERAVTVVPRQVALSEVFTVQRKSLLKFRAEL